MATIAQVKAGLSEFILSTMAPRMDESRQFWAGVAVAFASRKADHILRVLSQSSKIQMLDVFDGAGNIDIDVIFECIMEQFKRRQKLPISIPYFGDFAFTAHDAQELFDMIKRA